MPGVHKAIERDMLSAPRRGPWLSFGEENQSITGAVQFSLRALGIFLTGAFTGILLFVTWAEHNGRLEMDPAQHLMIMVGIPIALLASFIPWLLHDAAAGLRRLKGGNSQNQAPGRKE